MPIPIVQEAPEPEIWGPFSAEVKSGDRKLVEIAAVERSLPGMLRRGTLTYFHQESAVGRILPCLPIQEARLPTDEKVQRMVREVAQAHGGCLPTGILQVTQAMVDVFPKQLGGLLGKRVAFAAATVFTDDRAGKSLVQAIRAGVIDSFSINAFKFGSRPLRYCDSGGCEMVEHIPDLDLNTLTLASSTGAGGAAKAQNPAAAFVVVQQAARSVQGLNVRVEYAKGSVRSGKNKRGEAWERTVAHDYGHLPRTEGADGEEVDVYVGDAADAPLVFVIDQVDQESGAFDEHKVMLGFASQDEAAAAYRANYPEGWKTGPVTALSVDEFRRWLRRGDTTAPAEKLVQAERTERVIPLFDAAPLPEMLDARVAQGGCAARAMMNLAQAALPARVQALARADATLAEVLLQASEGWLGAEARERARVILDGAPDVLEAARARRVDENRQPHGQRAHGSGESMTPAAVAVPQVQQAAPAAPAAPSASPAPPADVGTPPASAATTSGGPSVTVTTPAAPESVKQAAPAPIAPAPAASPPAAVKQADSDPEGKGDDLTRRVEALEQKLAEVVGLLSQLTGQPGPMPGQAAAPGMGGAPLPGAGLPQAAPAALAAPAAPPAETVKQAEAPPAAPPPPAPAAVPAPPTIRAATPEPGQGPAPASGDAEIQRLQQASDNGVPGAAEALYRKLLGGRP